MFSFTRSRPLTHCRNYSLTRTDKFSISTNPCLTAQIGPIARPTECIYLHLTFCLHLKGLFVH